MLNILLFSFGIMYTPGPVNLLSLNVGLRKRPSRLVPFALGVACALGLSFLIMGYAGGAVVNARSLPYIAVPGCLFIAYLAFKVLTSPVVAPDAAAPPVPEEREDSAQAGEDGSSLTFRDGFSLTFRDGFFMQLLNPKSYLVVLPVTTVQFPAAGIAGAGVAVWAVGLALLGFGAPMSYAAGGALVGRGIKNPRVFKLFNACMSALLLYAAADIAYRNVYLPLLG